MKLKRDFFECAVDHVADFGDTDIFPYPIELKWIASKRVEISNSLASMDLANYHPMSLVESLIPKTKFGFRVAHQPFPIDTIIYTALVLSIFDKIESGRDSIANNRAFSYRKVFGLDKRIFEEKRKFKDWLEIIENMVFDTQYSHAIRTDISDFYSRIYRHRLENILDSLSGETAIVKKIEKFISDWRGGQSFGLPVGSNASRLLAEAALNDTDMGLISEGYTHTRYVDDMIILIKHGQDPYAALGYLAKQLAENEGLSLNNQKTQIYRWDEFISQIDQRDGSDDDGSVAQIG